jgi:hypothetical protein
MPGNAKLSGPLPNFIYLPIDAVVDFRRTGICRPTLQESEFLYPFPLNNCTSAPPATAAGSASALIYDVHLSFLHSAHANLTINMQLYIL